MSEATTREFEFVEGTSNKFWKITVDGLTHTVNYGRVGTAGQVQTKEFETAALAKTAGDKLIAEKVKKGYHETTSGATIALSTIVADVKSPEAGIEETVQDIDEMTVASLKPEHHDPLAITRTVKLSEDDYVRAGLRPRPRLNLPAAPAFDRESAVRRIVDRTRTNYWSAYNIPLDEPVSREEALLSLCACRNFRGKGYSKPDQIRTSELMAERIPATIDLQTLRDITSEIIPNLHFRLLSAEDFAHAVVLRIESGHLRQTTIEVIRNEVLPYASDDEVARMRKTVLTLLDKQPSHNYPIMAFLTALGEIDTVAAWVQSVPSPGRVSHQEGALDFLLWIPNSPFVVSQMVRLGVGLMSIADAKCWIAHAEVEGLGLLSASIPIQYSKSGAEDLVKTAGRILAPETAQFMLDWQLQGTAVAACKQWLDSNPILTVAGLVPIAAESNPKRSEHASALLSALAKRGYESVIRAHLGNLPPEVAERIVPAIFSTADDAKYEPLSEAETPASLKAPAGSDSKHKPGDLLPDELPAIIIPLGDEQRKLADDQFYALFHALGKSKGTEAHPYVASIRAAATRQSLDAFAWALFQEWISSGAPNKDKWKLIAIGLLGGDQCALKLTPLIRKWPGESQHVRAKLGIECLEAIGTDTALMQINGIAQKVPFKALKETAIKCMEGIARKRGLTRPELEDRIVPDCGLNERGSRIFDFGPRQFALSVSPEMKPVLRELKDGKPLPKLLTDLPKPNQKDDTAKSEEAVAEWKVLKKQVAETAKIQAVRLEQSMVTGRRWSSEEFDILLVRHPLMTNIVRLLVWGVFGDDGKLVKSFRVTEDLTAADSSDDVYVIPPSARIGVVHPLQLTDADKNAWGEIWSDYELVPPFPQLGRPICTLAPDEADSVELKRFSSAKIPCASLIFTLEKLSWQRGLPADGGGFNEHTKPFYGSGVTAVVTYDPGSWVGGITEGDDQTITEVFFIPRIYIPDEMWPAHKDRIPWKGIDPVVISEVLADVSLVASKAK